MLTVAITGSSGLVGTALTGFLVARKYRVIRVVRNPTGEPDTIAWNPENPVATDLRQWEGLSAIINLSGESIAGGRWTVERKRRILDSRIASTRTLGTIIARLQQPPPTLINASATGFYGNRGMEWVDEDSPGGNGFLADVCGAWEDEARKIEREGLRVVRLRLGMVLSANGGALPKMLFPFRFGLGGKFGNGKQYMSWISLDDLLSEIEFTLHNDSLTGAVNAVAPNPVPNAEFVATLAKALHRPAFAAVPGFVLKMALGEMAQELLLDGVRVSPKKLLTNGFIFRDPELTTAFTHLLG